MATYSITAAVMSGYRVRLTTTVTSATPSATMTITRQTGATSVPVPGAVDIPAVSSVVEDLAPLGRPVTYRVTASDGGTAVSAAVTVAALRPVVSDPHGLTVVEVEVIEYGDLEYDNGGQRVTTEGDREVVTFWRPESDPTLSLTVVVLTLADDARLAGMASSGGPMLLRWPNDNGESDLLVQPISGRRRLRYSPHSETVRHAWPLVQVVRPDLSKAATGDTYGDLAAYLGTGATYGVYRSTFPTYGAQMATDLKAG